MTPTSHTLESPANPERFTELLKRLEHSLPDLQVEPLSDDTRLLRIHSDPIGPGDLVVWVYDAEIILEIESLTHSHIDRFSVADNTPEDQLCEALVEATIEQIGAILRDDILIEVEYVDSKQRSVTLTNLRYSEPRKRKDIPGRRIEQYVWSGKLR